MNGVTRRGADSAIRQQVIADMKLAGLASGTQREYLRHMDQYVRATWIVPEQASEAQVAAYLQGVLGRGISVGTFKPVRAALQFLFENTLHRKWDVFKKDAQLPSGSGCPMPPRTRSAAGSSAAFDIPSTAPASPSSMPVACASKKPSRCGPARSTPRKQRSGSSAKATKSGRSLFPCPF